MCNIIANNIAKTYVLHLIATQHPISNPRFTDESWSLYLGPNKQTKFDKQRNYDYLTQPDIMEYWSQRLHKPIEDIYSVDWPSLASAISSLPPAQQRRASKHASGHFGCGSKLLQWQHQDHDECPFCNQVKDPHHVLTCPHPQPQQTWQTTIQKLQDKLTTMETDPALNTAIIQSLNNWNHHTAPPEHPPEHPVSQQTRIGW